ncbi:C2 domain, partial [Dillenia turbinata]
EIFKLTPQKLSLLLNANLFRNANMVGGMDPYVLIQYKSQERKSSVARGKGCSPTWNEKFTFRIDYPGDGDQYKLTLKIMDKDTFSADDFLGQATIYLKELLELGIENGKSQLHPSKYRVIHNGSYHGEICVGVNFTATVRTIDMDRQTSTTLLV